MTTDNETLPDTSPAAVLAMTRNLRTNGYELAARMMEALGSAGPAGWLPIESAPQDGTPILAFWPGGPAAVVSGRSYGITMMKGSAWVNADDTGDSYSTPSYWMPLPAAPGVSTVEDAQATYSMQPTTCHLQPVATAFFTEKGEVAYTGIFDRTLKALESVKTTRMGISAGSIDLYVGHACAPAAGDALDVDALSNAIRSIDGKHTMGAGELAEALMPLIQKASPAALNGDTERLDFLVIHRAWVGWSKDRELCAVYRRDDEGYTEPMAGWTPSYLTPREAIDAAIAAQQGPEES